MIEARGRWVMLPLLHSSGTLLINDEEATMSAYVKRRIKSLCDVALEPLRGERSAQISSGLKQKLWLDCAPGELAWNISSAGACKRWGKNNKAT